MNGRAVVLISGKDPTASAGGHETYVRAHGLAARRAGFDVHIFCSGRSSGSVSTRFGTVHRLALPVGGRPPVWLQAPLLARAVVAHLRDRPAGSPHVIHGFGIWSWAAGAAARRLERDGVLAVALASAYATRAYEVGAMQRALGPHLSRPRRLYYRLWLRWIEAVDDRLERHGYTGADVVLVNYDSVARILRLAYGADLRIRRIPYAPASAFDAEAPRSAARSLQPQAPLIVAVSRHDPRKGIDILLGALARLQASSIDFRACLVGPGALLESHRRLAASLGLGDSLEITGLVADVEPYLAAADVYVLPSLAEASGSVSVLEAMRARLPIVASACDGIPEDLTDGTDALLAVPGDPAHLADALARMLTDAELRARLAAAGRAAYDERFSSDRFTEALVDAYDSATEDRRRRTR